MSQNESNAEYQKVVQLFEDWRVFEEPLKTNDAPDYSPAARDAQFAKLGVYRDRADAIDIEALTRSERVDLEVIRCEMNGYEYYHRFFKPWQRDPGFYQLVRYGGNDIPGWHVPHLHNVLIPAWLEFPLDSEAYAKLAQQLSGIPHLVAQAKENLVGDHKDLYAIAQSGHEWSIDELIKLADTLKEHHPELVEKADACVVAAKDLLAWTKKRHDEMGDCGSGIGIEAFNWSMKNHHRVPYDWHQQEELLQRELDRAWATMVLEEHRNRNVEPLAAPKTPKEAARRKVSGEAVLIRVLRDMGVTELADWMSETWSVAPELQPITPLEDYSFFHHVDLRGWLALRPHQVHFFDLYKEGIETHPIRKHTGLYQTWLFRCEGFATAFEELLMRAGLEDSTPRTRELVHICAAFRAARALAIHRVHGKGWTLQQAFDFSVKYTPKGWIKRDEGLLYADLTTYLRQPEYGVSYNVGKVQVDRLLATRAEQLGDKFNLGEFFNDYFACGLIPASLIRWEMTGEEDELKQMGALQEKKQKTMNPSYDIAAYYWPAYHDDPRWRKFMPKGEGEWQIIRESTPKFDGHLQPRVPTWGYTDESDPAVMEQKIEAAADHGVNVFIFDWYWYENQPFLEEALNSGFLGAKNNDKMRFYVMWANHDAPTSWDIEKSHEYETIWPGAVDRETFDTATDRLIERYFGHPSYYTIDGKPVFSIYELGTLVEGLGGMEATRDALDSLRARVCEAGFPGLHIQAMLWGNIPKSMSMVPGDDTPTQDKTISALGIDSLTNYQWVHYVPDTKGDYKEWGEEAIVSWKTWAEEFSVPFFPHVAVGWDTNPRFKAFMENTITGGTPDKFKEFLSAAMDFVDAGKLTPPLITINSWNEWSEGSYLEPDTTHGMGYLEAVRDAIAERTTWE